MFSPPACVPLSSCLLHVFLGEEEQDGRNKGTHKENGARGVRGCVVVSQVRVFCDAFVFLYMVWPAFYSLRRTDTTIRKPLPIFGPRNLKTPTLGPRNSKTPTVGPRNLKTLLTRTLNGVQIHILATKFFVRIE